MALRTRRILWMLAVAGICVAVVQAVREGDGARTGSPATSGIEPPGWVAEQGNHLDGETHDLFGDLLARGDLDTITQEGSAGGLSSLSPHAFRAMESRAGVEIPAVEPAPSFADGASSLSLPWRTEPLELGEIHQFCTADFNRDDVIDEDDASAFRTEWADRSGPLAPMLDIDRDGWLTDDDFSGFFASFDEGCEPEAQLALRNGSFEGFQLVISRIVTQADVKVDLRYAPEQSFRAGLVQRGSGEFVVELSR